MTIKSLLSVIIRVLGIYWMVYLAFSYLPYTISSIYSQYHFSDNNELLLYEIAALILALVMIFIIYKSLVVNPDQLIDKMQPVSFLEQTVDFGDLNTKSMLKIGLITVGIMTMAMFLPYFINDIFASLKLKYYDLAEPTKASNDLKFKMIADFLGSIIGFVLIIYSGKIADKIYNSNKLDEN